MDSFIKHNSVSDKTKLILMDENKIKGINIIMNYLLDRDYYQKQNPDNQFLKEKINSEYYSFLKDLPLNRKSFLINNEFSEFVNRFEYADLLKFYAKPKKFTPEVSQLEYFELRNIPLTVEEKELLMHHGSFTEEEKVSFKKVREKYSQEISAYIHKYIESYITNSIDFMEPWHKKDSVITNILHLKNDLIYDITKTRSLKYDIERINNADQAYNYWNELSTTIENDFLKQEGERMIQNKFPKKQTSSIENPEAISMQSEIIPLPNGKAKDLFYDIANQYKGKIVFVDFWATSCGPCIATIKNMKEVRKKYKNNPDFEFVFITDEAQSPINSYQKFTKYQEMTNLHRVDTDTYNRFRELFKFNGIPKYIVLNKQGEVIDEDFEMYRFSSELSSILGKYK